MILRLDVVNSILLLFRYSVAFFDNVRGLGDKLSGSRGGSDFKTAAAAVFSLVDREKTRRTGRRHGVPAPVGLDGRELSCGEFCARAMRDNRISKKQWLFIKISTSGQKY